MKVFINLPQNKLLLYTSLLLFSCGASGELLDAQDDTDTWLAELAVPLDSHGIDVLDNLNHRQLARGRIDKPRLGHFPDIPVGLLPDSVDLLNWEAGYANGEIGGIAILPDDLPTMAGNPEPDYTTFLQNWYQLDDRDRVFISFTSEDGPLAESIVTVIRSQGHPVRVFTTGDDASLPGRLYATAGNRLALDSEAARDNDNEVREFDYLGERVRRNSDSLFVDSDGDDRRVARNEPSIFRKSTLGDEYEASTIREIIVPGGIAFGESAVLPWPVDELIFTGQDFFLIDENQKHWRLPAADQADLKALFDFVQRSETLDSDAIVDIDAQGRVKISAALRDTDVGYHLMEIDTEPFKYVRGLSVNKSVIIDNSVVFDEATEADALKYQTVYEVRFLSADSMRIAQTRVALEFENISGPADISHSYAWGNSLGRLQDDLDLAGLGNSTASIAEYAAWAALFRMVRSEPVKFLQGRYEFLKVDKRGRSTPRRH